MASRSNTEAKAKAPKPAAKAPVPPKKAPASDFVRGSEYLKNPGRRKRDLDKAIEDAGG